MNSQLEKLNDLLENAEGRSEHAIVVVCDIRGFSEFSTKRESPDTAMFIKRFYKKLINEYFNNAHFAKPTGDGLLMIFKFTEKNLQEISAEILNACFKCINDFPDFFKNDPMINYETPTKIGFGITRGPVCCLHTNDEIIDYSGKLLNLASRLTDLARPSGIVIDGGYLFKVIPEKFRTKFKNADIYVRSIAEDTTITVYYSTPDNLPDYCFHPIKEVDWEKNVTTLTAKNLSNLSGHYVFRLTKKALSKFKININYTYPNKAVKGFTITKQINDFEYEEKADGPRVRINLSKVKEDIITEKMKPTTEIEISVEYIPKQVKVQKQKGLV